MGLRFRCARCGAVLYEYGGENYRPEVGVPAPGTLVALLNGRCPRCGAELRGRVVKVVVSGRVVIDER